MFKIETEISDKEIAKIITGKIRSLKRQIEKYEQMLLVLKQDGDLTLETQGNSVIKFNTIEDISNKINTSVFSGKKRFEDYILEILEPMPKTTKEIALLYSDMSGMALTTKDCSAKLSTLSKNKGVVFSHTVTTKTGGIKNFWGKRECFLNGKLKQEYLEYIR